MPPGYPSSIILTMHPSSPPILSALLIFIVIIDYIHSISDLPIVSINSSNFIVIVRYLHHVTLQAIRCLNYVTLQALATCFAAQYVSIQIIQFINCVTPLTARYLCYFPPAMANHYSISFLVCILPPATFVAICDHSPFVQVYLCAVKALLFQLLRQMLARKGKVR